MNPVFRCPVFGWLLYFKFVSITISGQIESLSLFDETELDPLVKVEEPDDPTSPRYPVVLQLDRDWLLKLQKQNEAKIKDEPQEVNFGINFIQQPSKYWTKVGLEYQTYWVFKWKGSAQF